MEIDKIDQIIDKHHGEASSLLQILLDIQSENSWLPKEALGRVSDKLDVPLARIQHIATFYKAFSLVPKGRHKVHICMGTACHIKGGNAILKVWETKLGIREGEVTEDRLYSLDRVACVGCCAMAPVAVVGEEVHGNMIPVTVDGIMLAVELAEKRGREQEEQGPENQEEAAQ